MATINLAPSTHYIAVARRRRQILFTSSGIIALLLFIIWLSLFLVVKASEGRLSDIQGQIAAVQTQIASSNDDVDRITAFEQRINGLDALLKNRTTLAPFFAELEKLLPPATILTSIDLNVGTGDLQLTGKVPSVDDVAQTIASLNRTDSTIFQTVTVNQLLRKDAEVAGQPPFYQIQLTVHLRPNALRAVASAPPT